MSVNGREVSQSLAREGERRERVKTNCSFRSVETNERPKETSDGRHGRGDRVVRVKCCRVVRVK